ncbi:MAG TPA: phage terminase small subunit [Sphingomonas sp.]|jgi:hypothetical protein|uniref:phage terminase small subunit n=1 Tax=Sphingomonas sp. TaxID=28214 RepID=UPI002ED8C798
MSPARHHRERLAALAASGDLVVVGVDLAEKPDMTAVVIIDGHSPARLHQVLHAAGEAVDLSETSEGDPLARPPANGVEAQMRLRLRHDLRRLKDVASIERRAEIKRDELLPEYAAWVDGILAASEDADHAVGGEILPTVMIWRIDAGDYAGALPLAAYVLRHDIPLPVRYNRSAPALIAEEMAEAALKAQAADQPFSLEILEEVDALTAHADMHDEIRAKLMKAIGVELIRQADDLDAAGPEYRGLTERALAPLRRAQALHDRSGVKGHIKRLEKLLLAPPVAPEAPPATDVTPPAPPADTEQSGPPAA